MDVREAHHAIGSYVTPLVISAAGIICSTLALAAYHFIVLRYCLRPQRMQQQRRNNANNNNRSRVKSCGVQEEILNKIPVVSYSTKTSDAFRLDQNECSICLGELEDGDLVRLLPSCNHAFHIPCIDAWFVEHASCPVCRSPINCDCESATVPTASGNGGEQRVSHETPSDHHHHQLMDDDVSRSTSRIQQPLQHPVWLRHSVSISSQHMQKKPRVLGMVLKRSLSMDQSSSYIAITIQREREEASTSSSTKWVVTSQYNYKSRSLRHLDHMSSVLMRSFSQFRNSRSGRSNGILPN